MTVLSAKEIQALTAAADLSDLPVKYRKIIAGLLARSGTQARDADLFVDGAADLHSQTAGIGGAVFVEGKEIYCFSEPLLNKTNNEAEYTALLKGIQTILELKLVNINIYSDSELIVNQIKGKYNIKNDRMIVLHGQVMDALNGVKTWSIHHIRREKNKRADGLSKQGMALAKAAK